MKLIKSIFWLSVAFVAIGPNMNAVNSLEGMSQRAMDGGGQFVTEHLGQLECRSIECIGGKAMISASLDMLPARQAETDIQASTSVPFVPAPMPRLSRKE